MNDLKQFENRNDDWLAKQRRLEEKISPWDLDDARKIKEEHAIRHQQYNQRQEEFRKYRQTRRSVPSGSSNTLAKLVAVFVIIVFLMVLIPIVISFTDYGFVSVNFFPIFFIFIVIILFNLGGRKKW